MTSTQRSAALISWFWQDGHKRPCKPLGAEGGSVNREKYRLPVDSWLAPLYRAHTELQELDEASKPRPPALALWGGSQTGKSTALSFIDGEAALPGVAGEDGKGGGLHWEGGVPFVYQLPPRQDAPEHWNTCAYNPFNQGDDGSACLTRIVAASNTAGDGVRRVEDPLHPVEVRLIKPIELLNTLARGFDTQCLGSRNAGRPKPWTAEHLETVLTKEANKFQAQVKEDAGHDQVACERLFDLIATVESLYDLRVETFGELAESPEALRQLLNRLLLQQEAFVSLPAAADAALGLVLWRGSELLSNEYRRLRAWHEKLMVEWAGKPVYCSLTSAMLFVDFGSGINQLKGQTSAARQRLQADLIRQLGWVAKGDRILIGSGAAYANKLGSTAAEYAMTQALVWEVVLPVNLDNLPDTPGKMLLAEVDILDFPGVGKDSLNETSRLNLDVSDQAGGKVPEGGAAPSFPVDFFGKILKRGKTASVVANYARRRNIDSFAILQSLKSDTAPSAEMVGQILEGCTTWARYSGYETNGDEPVPLHFILTFWGQKAATFAAGTSVNFRNAVGKHIESYGWVRERATAWALNYHWFRNAQGEKISEVDLKHFTFESEVYKTVTQEEDFLEVYGRELSRRSFDAMINEERGGLDYFLTELRGELARIDFSIRQQRLLALRERQEQTVATLCAWPYLRPPLHEKDDRIDTIVDFRARLLDTIAPFSEAKMREAGYALRELVGVDPEQLPAIELDEEKLGPSFVDFAFNQWISQQAERYNAWKTGTAPFGPTWSLLAFKDAEAFSSLLQKLVECLGEPVYSAIAASLVLRKGTLEASPSDYQKHQLRRYLAIEMVNWLCYYVPDPLEPTRRIRTGRHGSADLSRYSWEEPDAWPRSAGAKTQAWKQALEPWLDWHLGCLLANIARKPERPDLPGDAALSAILNEA